ncbi:hypothetical protein [Rhizobium sp. Root1204]|uniref:hypothetical protein n=1 Tax=Rhizobium sp. Root1204 TaxID=1736428 RepID=UPI000715CA37|nr:hypothetical protein [Rhizobium sp. Root1204]KQV31136.1 hypothetical protein ASC96_08065 [Rhizobium sp. Root1204]
MKIRLKAPEGLNSTGIYGKNGEEMPVGHEMEVAEEPKGWAGRYDILSGGPVEGSEAITNLAGYVVKDKGGAWFVITKDGEEVTKSFRKADVEGFDTMSDEDKEAFVDLHKKEA